MEQSSHEERYWRDRYQQFIPISLENINPSGNSYFLTPKKGVILALGLLPSYFVVSGVMNLTYRKVLGFFVGLFIYILIYLTVVRIFVLEEFKWRKVLADLKMHKVSNHELFWDIDRIDDNGVIHYSYGGTSNLAKGFVFKVVGGTNIGKEENYDLIYRDGVAKVLRRILKMGLYLDVYELRNMDRLPPNIKAMNDNLVNIEDELTRQFAREHVKHLAEISKYSRTVVETYYVITVEGSVNFKRMKNIIETLDYEFKSSGVFHSVELLDGRGVHDFIEHYLELDTIVSSKKAVELIDFDEIGEVLRAFDTYGDEILVEEIESLGEVQEDDGLRESKGTAPKIIKDLKEKSKERKVMVESFKESGMTPEEWEEHIALERAKKTGEYTYVYDGIEYVYDKLEDSYMYYDEVDDEYYYVEDSFMRGIGAPLGFYNHKKVMAEKEEAKRRNEEMRRRKIKSRKARLVDGVVYRSGGVNYIYDETRDSYYYYDEEDGEYYYVDDAYMNSIGALFKEKY